MSNFAQSWLGFASRRTLSIGSLLVILVVVVSFLVRLQRPDEGHEAVGQGGPVRSVPLADLGSNLDLSNGVGATVDFTNAHEGSGPELLAMGQSLLGTELENSAGRGRFTWSNPGDRRGVAFIDSAAGLGVVHAMREAAELRLSGAKEFRDAAYAENLLLRAASLGDGDSMLRLARGYRLGDFGEPDLIAAENWALAGAEVDCWQAMLQLAWWNLDGTTGRPDYAAAKAWAARAMEAAPESQQGFLQSKLTEIGSLEAAARSAEALPRH